MGMRSPTCIIEVDTLGWRWEDNRHFSTRSAYCYLQDHSAMVSNSDWKFIWRKEVPQRFRVFLWLGRGQRLLTNLEQYRRHLTPSSLCQIYKMGEESVEHVLRSCPMTHNIWSALIPDNNWNAFMNLPFEAWLMSNLCAQAMEFKASNITRKTNENGGTQLPWQKPLEGWVKENVDMDCKPQTNDVTGGGVLRDKNENCYEIPTEEWEECCSHGMSQLHGASSFSLMASDKSNFANSSTGGSSDYLGVRSHRLEKLLTGALQPLLAIILGDDGTIVENEQYEVFMAQDTVLASWLFPPSILFCFLNLSALRLSPMFGKRLISSFPVKEITDALADCGSPVLEIEKIATLLNGHLPEHRSCIAIITASREPFTLEGVIFVLSTDDDHLDNFYTPMNYGQAQNFHGGRGRGRSKLQCQLCGKIDQLVDRCWYRFDKTFLGVSVTPSTHIRPGYESRMSP
ncbi:hypothetical protein F3Y22_tig00110013pilonHSYRG00110 [Hibiscus syriacus]|uniref:Reverse transcriptase zinc-binding domain-containing protein n=1 Tax=Hibiscus syriacus TaxID=106335 RepID=A0A6A3BNC0_HIBSY|nr:hypothetical protein F3Y22_tig00110013pilonHSYRG00110 [Hibiscus syriacus]